MEIGSFVTKGIQELLYFDIWESLFLILLFFIESKQRTSIKKCLFHIFMLSLLNLLISNIITIPIILQITYILMMALYLSLMFRIKFIKSLIINTKVYFILFVLEAMLSIIYNFMHIELLSLQNDLTKAIYMIPMKLVEIIFIYVYYKLMMKGDEIHYEKSN